MRKWILAAAFTLMPAVGHSQTITIGTTPGAPTDVYQIIPDSDGYFQSFVAPAPWLTRISFWYRAGTSPDDRLDWYSRFQLYQDAEIANGPFLIQYLSPTTDGRVDIKFNDPLQVVTGQTYAFGVYVNGCGGTYTPECDTPVGIGYVGPAVQLTTVDAFAGGTAIQWHDVNLPNNDLRFEATFEVAEAAPLPMMVAGVLMMLAAAVIRRRKSAR